MKGIFALLVWVSCGAWGTLITLRERKKCRFVHETVQTTALLVHRLLDSGMTMKEAVFPIAEQNDLWAQWLVHQLYHKEDEPDVRFLDERIQGLMMPPLSLQDPIHSLRGWQKEWVMLDRKMQEEWKKKGMLAAQLGWILGAGAAMLML